MTFGEMQALTSYWLDDLNFGYFTTTQVKVWLNNAQKRLQRRLLKAGENYYVECAETTLVVNQREYVLPDDFLKLHRLELIISGTSPNETKTPIKPITMNQQDMAQTGSGTPYCYFIKKNRLVLFPAPDTALTLRLNYSYLITDMVSDSDVADAPDQYQEMIPLLAAEDGFIKDGRTPELLVKKIQEFGIETDQDADERTQDQPRGIVETGNSNGGYFW